MAIASDMAFADVKELFSFDLWDENDSIVTNEGIMQDPCIISSNLSCLGMKSSDKQPFGEPSTGMDISTGLSTDSFPSLEKSPWHESDSGASTMSDTGSAIDLPTSEMDSVLHETAWPSMNDDLAAYLLGSDVSMSMMNELNQNQPEFAVSASVQPQAAYNTRSRSNPRPSAGQKTHPIYQDDFVNVENSDSECSHGDLSPTRSNGSTTPQPLNYFQESVSSSRSKPAVKIVKVLKATTSSDCCDDDIMKALDERSKKNAIQAKMNREKKKKYVTSLEKDVERLTGENDSLREENTDLNKQVGSLEEEVRYLRSVLANASALSGLLRNIGGVSEVKLSASIVGKKRVASTIDDHSYTSALKAGESSKAERSAKRAKLVQENLQKAGVCLHVNGAEASLEFCAKCSSLSQLSQGRGNKS